MRFVRLRIGHSIAACGVLCASGCTTFGGVRSAQVEPGFGMEIGATASTPPGDAAAWFFSFDCATNCDHAVVAPEITFTQGFLPVEGRPFEFGAGVSGIFPQIHGYLQLKEGRRPFGVGLRLGLPIYNGWHQQALQVRQDFPLSGEAKLLSTTTILLQSTTRNLGTFVALAQGFGYEAGSVTPSLSLVLGWSERVWVRDLERHPTAFLVAGVRVRSRSGAKR